MYLSASRRSGARVDGTVNIRERSVKRRYYKEAQDAGGLSQNGRVAGTGACLSPVVDTQRHRRIERTYPIWLSTRNTVSPSASQQGRSVARPTDGRAGKGRWRKRRAVRNGPHRDCVTATLSPVKAGRLPPGLSSRERLANRLRRQSR